jgi:hypothetical protein
METENAILGLVIQGAIDFSVIIYIGFFAVHAAQRVEDPVQRLGWLLLIVGLNVLGTTLYLLTKYRKFRAIGKGNWIVAKKWTWSVVDYFQLSEAERM